MATRLSEEDRRAALTALSAWTYDQASASITRIFTFDNFRDAFAFMTKVALLAERLDHHPDWTNVYDRVTITLTDYEAGGLSQRDVDMAAMIDQLT